MRSVIGNNVLCTISGQDGGEKNKEHLLKGRARGLGLITARVLTLCPGCIGLFLFGV